MPTEKERFLAVATPEEWWKWANDPWKYGRKCLLCRAYDNCDDCKTAGGHDLSQSGCYPHINARLSAITRLKRVGIWEEGP